MSDLENHLLRVESDFFESGYVASCSCGWSEQGFATSEEAIDAWEDHCDAVFIKATETIE